jgi:hypothetical protein
VDSLGCCLTKPAFSRGHGSGNRFCEQFGNRNVFIAEPKDDKCNVLSFGHDMDFLRHVTPAAISRRLPYCPRKTRPGKSRHLLSKATAIAALSKESSHSPRRQKKKEDRAGERPSLWFKITARGDRAVFRAVGTDNARKSIAFQQKLYLLLVDDLDHRAI